MKPDVNAQRNAALLEWFDRRGRTLAFRVTGGTTADPSAADTWAADPWAVLVSEVMLQQTQVGRIEAAWARFMARFPRPTDLASASPADVLRAWAGLGYNGRAIRLRLAARAIVERHGGAVPDDLVALQALPGVGAYTARAVSAIAFGRCVAALDTNIRRVLGRVTGTAIDQATADILVDRERPADWTHATMDIGATICRPTAPDCPACPLNAWCAYASTVERPLVPRAPRSASLPFPSTTRWLRGRIIDRLRSSADGAWVRLDAPIGEHDTDHVAAAIATLERDGLLEQGPDGAVRLPSHP